MTIDCTKKKSTKKTTCDSCGTPCEVCGEPQLKRSLVLELINNHMEYLYRIKHLPNELDTDKMLGNAIVTLVKFKNEHL